MITDDNMPGFKMDNAAQTEVARHIGYLFVCGAGGLFEMILLKP
jgi:hypothetical protein